MPKLASLAQYGAIGTGTYLTLSACVTTCIFFAIENHFDVAGALKWALGDSVEVEETLEKWGLAKRATSMSDSVEKDSWTQGYLNKAPSLALAVIASKALIPIKVPIAAVLTPYVRRVLLARGLVKSQRGSENRLRHHLIYSFVVYKSTFPCV
eukprot:TRINITY_DN20131_c0_g1_i2.p3 TRINITY_DN20131_c0_g1~~TRINITY_DN20131_c0_g1_i2.p3  ORF type:complete len:153 (+),score=5.23 TRINITY_DN20131_c0_g1_i2:465-923(+)